MRIQDRTNTSTILIILPGLYNLMHTKRLYTILHSGVFALDTWLEQRCMEQN